MSWGVQAGGKSDQVAKDIEKHFENMSSCEEPEETIKQQARKIIAIALEGNNPARTVNVSAWGSQSKYFSKEEDKEPSITNSLHIEIG